MENLDLSDCELSQIDRNAFQWLRYLNSLNVARTRLGDVALQNLSYSLSEESLKFFSISELKTNTYFRKEFFTSLADSHIEYINLSKNRFSYCIPKVLDVAKIVYCTLGPLLVFGTVLVLVWYRFKWDVKYFLFLARSRTRTFKEHVTCDRYAFDAFISYCDKDLPWVRNHLLPAVENDEDRISCCIPDRNFIAGNCALNTTAAAISQSRTTVLVVSNEYLKTDDGFETAVAEHKLFEETRNGLILILLEPIHKDRITKHLQYIIRTRTCIQWTQNATGQKLFWKRLRLAIMHPENKSSIFSHIT
ncbi:toll-like receptor Tollo [Caerostris extrusa]|uniref:Toll-like receptor Tollo n=1 Tax=Caerostris extrusa TaxID=172846 RepID=A0AAV4Q028_CAEEX|nr:toll-like receptor Tollo [Caerostris extrusa]